MNRIKWDAKVIIAIVLCLFPFLCFATDIAPYSARVSVDVTAEENIKGKIESYIIRELRNLGDIIVTDQNPDWTFQIVAKEMSTKDGHKKAMNFSILILKPFDNKVIMDMVPVELKKIASAHMLGLYTISDHWLRESPSENLGNICNCIVADFDRKHLKKDKDIYQDIIDEINKRSQRNNP